MINLVLFLRIVWVMMYTSVVVLTSAICCFYGIFKAKLSWKHCIICIAVYLNFTIDFRLKTNQTSACELFFGFTKSLEMID